MATLPPELGALFMELEDLAGEHLLSGVDFGTLPRDEDAYQYEDSSAMTFVIDGHAYCAIEDPQDGYRSCMRDLIEVPVESVKNKFKAVRVVGVYRHMGHYGTDDVLELRDVTNGLLVLEVGTDNTNDYYPSYVANFKPENMAINGQRGDEATGPTTSKG